MPELPEVETMRAGLAAACGAARVMETQVRRRDLRVRVPSGLAARLAGRRILGWERRAKYLMVRLQARPPWREDILFLHLGMSGRLALCAQPPPQQTHDHVLWRLETGTRKVWLIFRDPRRFGYMGLVAAHAQAAHARFRTLGVEPLGAEFTPAFLAERLAGARTSLKSFLLNQRHIAGLGNIYVCEALSRARLHPAQEARKAAPHAAGLRHAIRQTLRQAIKAGGSSLGQGKSNFVAATGEMGYFQLRFAVYGRQGRACRRRACGGIVQRFRQAGRSSFFCPRCQPAP